MGNADNLFGSQTNGSEPKARGRGRPRKSEPSGNNGIADETVVIGNEADGGGNGASGSEAAAGGEEIQAAISPESATGAEEPVKQRRGRKPGSSNKKAGTEGLALDAKELAPQIQGLHVMLATMTGQPVFQLSDIEAKMLASNIANVSQHYNITASSKSMAIVGLIAVCGMIYLPRVASVKRAARPVPTQAAMPSMPDQAMETPVHGRYDFSGDVGNGMKH